MNYKDSVIEDAMKLRRAVSLIKEVNENFAEAYQNKISNKEKMTNPTTEFSPGAIPMKMKRMTVELKMISDVMLKSIYGG